MRPEQLKLVRAWLKALADQTGAFEVESVTPSELPAVADQKGDYTALLIQARTRERIRLLIEGKARLNPRDALAVCAQVGSFAQDPPFRREVFDAVVVASPFISPRVAEICRAHGVGYLDQAGNCDIRANGLVVHVEGRPNVAPDTRPLARPFAPKASRVARLMLNEPKRTWQVQELASEGRISLGLASKSKDLLIKDGYVEEKEGRIALRDAQALVESWAAAYRSTARRTQLYKMDELPGIERAAAKWCRQRGIDYGLAEFSGAWRLAPMVRYKQACICVRDSVSQDVVGELTKALDSKPVETGSNFLVLVTSDEAVFFDRRETDGLHVLSPLQLFLDLSTQSGRGKEAADELRRRVLEPAFADAWQHADQSESAR